MKRSLPKIITGVVFIFIGGFILFGGLEIFSEYQRTKDCRTMILGKVLNKDFTRALDGNTVYRVRYSFTPPGGGEIHADGIISKSLWDILKINDDIQVKFNPVKPENNFPAESGGASLILVFFTFLFGFVFLLFGMSRIVSALRKRL